MNLVNDYFLLYHGVQYEDQAALNLKQQLDEELFCEVSALILICNRKSLPRFINLKSFTDLVLKISEVIPHKLDTLYALQYSLINTIKQNKSKQIVERLHIVFNYLKDEELLRMHEYEKLISLFDPKDFHSFENNTIASQRKDQDFFEEKEEIQALLSELKLLDKDVSFQQGLDKVEIYLNKQNFSVGITGVMNAGKSTLLNALIGQEILGSSVVPETANLSLIKYALKPYAKVLYWSKGQWEDIISSAQEIETMATFVKQSEEAFKDELSKYILDEARVDEIPVDDLHLYTSAKHIRSNLIKQIELGMNLNFLSEGIEIVDTPGLDDVVIQREELTKDYLSKCDLMIHLMNVAQSATQKDISFIIDALLYQNIGKLLIILTRADSVTPSELDEVIAYTKKSIKNQLKVRNEASKLDFILSSLEFIPISAKMALLHKMGQEEEALKDGFSIEKTGILEVEAYLHKVLYGKDSTKSELIINAAKSQIRKVIEEKTTSLHYSLQLLSKSEDEIKIEIDNVSQTKSKNIKLIQEMKDDIQSYKDESVHFLQNLDAFLQTQIFNIKQRLCERLIDNFFYAVQKKEKKVFLGELELTLDRALKDGLIDIIREYRYKFTQKAEAIGEKLESQYESHAITMEKQEDGLGVLELINEHFSSTFINASSMVLTSRLKRIFLSANIKERSSLQVNLNKALDDSFDGIFKAVNSRLESINAVLIQELFNTLSYPLSQFEQKLHNEEKLLNESLSNFEHDEKKRAEYSIQMHKILKSLIAVSQRLKL